MTNHPSTAHLTALGNKVDGALTAADLETFDAPQDVQRVTFTTHEVTALCPVTNQPDLYTVTIEYVPNKQCVESKTLKLYLMQWRNTGIFGEALTDIICADLAQALTPSFVRVTTVQQIRGGLQMTTVAERCNMIDVLA